MIKRLYIIVCSLVLFLTIALAIVYLVGGALARRFSEPLTRLDISFHGNDSVLTIGDYIVLLGVPTGEGLDCYGTFQGSVFLPNTGCDTVDIWFGNEEVDVKMDGFSPRSVVDFTNEDDTKNVPRWRGFTTLLPISP